MAKVMTTAELEQFVALWNRSFGRFDSFYRAGDEVGAIGTDGEVNIFRAIGFQEDGPGTDLADILNQIAALVELARQAK